MDSIQLMYITMYGVGKNSLIE